MSARLLAYFVRHGETGLNADKCFRGPFDPSLNEHGYADAEKLKSYFKDVDLGESFSSPKLRAQETANIILSPHDTEPMIDKNLMAWNVGHLGGLKKSKHQDEIDYYQNHPDEPIPGGESLNAFKTRVRPSIRHIIQRGVETGLPSLAIAHSSIIHEIGAMFHGHHGAVLVHPGGVVGVYHDSAKGLGSKGLYAEPLLKGKNKPEGYGS